MYVYVFTKNEIFISETEIMYVKLHFSYKHCLCGMLSSFLQVNIYIYTYK